MRLSKNFCLKEFTKSAGIRLVATPEQIFCLNVLCKNILQSIRDEFGGIRITSGLRNERSYELLRARGYPASKTSDHFAWSSAHPPATGAADIVPLNADIEDVFYWSIDNLKPATKQIIYYPDKNIIHVSNAHELIFKMPIDYPQERRVMIFEDGEFKPYKRQEVVNIPFNVTPIRY